MKTKEHKILSIAVASGKIGYVFMVDGLLMDWGLSHNASATPGLAKCKVYDWIRFYRPSVILTEKLHKYSRKGKRVHTIIAAISDVVQASKISLIEIERENTFRNKYDEIDALSQLYPKIEAWAPHKRTASESELRETIIFEALSMVMQVNEPPADLPM